MRTSFNEEQKKRLATIAAVTVIMGFCIGFVVAIGLSRKDINKLHAKIYKLEGWQ